MLSCSSDGRLHDLTTETFLPCYSLRRRFADVAHKLTTFWAGIAQLLVRVEEFLVIRGTVVGKDGGFVVQHMHARERDARVGRSITKGKGAFWVA